MNDKEVGASGVGLLEPPQPVEALPPTPAIQTLPPSIESALHVPESADSASIVSRLHEFDIKRVGDDRKVRHERAKYIEKLLKTQSLTILTDAASHFMSVGEDGKIKESSSLKSLRDRLVKEKGNELATSGMDKADIVKEQVTLYKSMLVKAADTLPEEQKTHYMSKRLTPNVAAKRRTLEGRNKRTVTEMTGSAPISHTSIEEGSVSRRMLAEAQQPKIDAAQAALDRAKNPLPSDNPDAFFQGIREHAANVQPQNVETAAFDRSRQHEADRLRTDTDNLIKAEEARNQERTDAANEAEARRDALKSQGTYVDPGDPQDRAGQERVKDYAIQAQEALQEANRLAEEAVKKAAFEKERAEQKAKFDAVKIETSTGYTNTPSKHDLSDTPLPSEKKNDFFAFVGEKAAEAQLEQTKADEILDDIRQDHVNKAQSEAEEARDPLKDMRERAQRAADAGRPINYGDRIDLRTGRLSVQTQSSIASGIEENMKQNESRSDSMSAEGRVSRFGGQRLRTVVLAGMLASAALVGPDVINNSQDSSSSSDNNSTQLDTTMPVVENDTYTVDQTGSHESLREMASVGTASESSGEAISEDMSGVTTNTNASEDIPASHVTPPTPSKSSFGRFTSRLSQLVKGGGSNNG